MCWASGTGATNSTSLTPLCAGRAPHPRFEYDPATAIEMLVRLASNLLWRIGARLTDGGAEGKVTVWGQ
jgi:hypothetical protein